jgi:hypothetical protein
MLQQKGYTPHGILRSVAYRWERLKFSFNWKAKYKPMP